MTTDGRNHARRHLVGGLILIAIGVMLLLDRFYILDFSQAIRVLWPLALIAVGVAKLLCRTTVRRLGPGQDNASSTSS